MALQKRPIYKGFNSFEYLNTRQFTLTEVDIVKADLLNHIFTTKGERVHMSNFGTTIPELTFEPLDQLLVEEIEEQLIAVFEFDPRVELLDLQIIPAYDYNTVQASAELLFIELNMVDRLELNLVFDSEG